MRILSMDGPRCPAPRIGPVSNSPGAVLLRTAHVRGAWQQKIPAAGLSTHGKAFPAPPGSLFR
jgi:hypothetical protein